MRQVAVISVAIFLGGVTTVTASPFPPDGLAGELAWVMLACSALVAVLALEADLG